MRQRASPCAYPHGDTGEGNDAHDAERNMLLSMRGYVTKDLSTETGPSARILIAPRRLPRLPARTGFFCLIQHIKSFSARILPRVSLRLSLQEYGDA